MNSFSLPQPSQIKPTRVLSLEYYSEGPVIDSEGNLYISHGTSISRMAPGGDPIIWATTAAPNGHKVMTNGDHLVCDAKQHAVLRLDSEGRWLGRAAGGRCDDLEIHSPNDICLHPGIGFYFTDSLPQTGAVYFVDRDGNQKIVARDLDTPNGIVLSADYRRLYVSESYPNRVTLISLGAPGQAEQPPRVFADLPRHATRESGSLNLPDGMALDRNNRLWVAHYGMTAVQVLSPDGRLLATYDTGMRCTSNICFAGDNLATAYITGGDGEPGPGALVRLDVGVPGLPILPAGR
jgi:gluconolactonase